jgi:hypothetical protein
VVYKKESCVSIGLAKFLKEAEQMQNACRENVTANPHFSVGCFRATGVNPNQPYFLFDRFAV